MRNASGHQGKNEWQRQKKPTGTLDFSKSPLQFFFPVGYTFLKDFSYLHVWRKIYREKNQPLTS